MGLRSKLWSEKNAYLILLIILWGVSSFFAIRQALYLFHNFRGILCDTAVTQNAMVNIVHGHIYRETAYCGPNVLGIHSHFIFLPMALIYALFPSVDFFFALQILGAQSFAFPIYWIANKELKRPLLAFFIALASLLNPMLSIFPIVPLHPEVWILPAVLWSYYFYLQKQPWGFWLCFVFAVCCGEHAAIIYAAMGVALLCGGTKVEWGRRYGWYALAGGVGWMLLAMGLIIPLFRSPVQYDNFASKYSHLGVGTPVQLLQFMLTNPVGVFAKICDAERWVHVFNLVGVSLFFSIASLESFILLLPLPLFWLMKNNEFYLQIHAYYFQFFFFSTAIGTIAFARRWELRARIVLLIAAAVVAGVNGFMLVHMYSIKSSWYSAGGEEAANEEIRREFEKIPLEAGVYASHRHSGELSNHVNMVMGDLREENLDFDRMINVRLGETTVRADQISYIVVDLVTDQPGIRELMVNRDHLQKRSDNIQRLIDSKKWKLIWNQHGVAILRRWNEAQAN